MYHNFTLKLFVMNRKSLVLIHLIATGVATLTIATFFSTTIISELSGDINWIINVKRGILYALPLLFISMPTIGITGSKLAGNNKSKVILRKMFRMKIIAFNGLSLVVLAITLYLRVNKGSLDITFWILQILELLLGATNLTLIGYNISDGINLKEYQIK